MTSRVLNFLWLNLDLPAPPDPEDGSIRKPLPEEYIENMRNAAKAHPSAQIDLWVDSKRLTEKQMAYLRHVVGDGVLQNVHLCDLRSIPAYDSEKLYNEAETSKNWRSGDSAKIWLQVDTAKILISLQGDFDQHFFADMDHYHLDIESDKVQEMLGKHGLMIGSYSEHSASNIENQLWGFTRRRRDFFEQYYVKALEAAYRGNNGYDVLGRKSIQLQREEKIRLKEFCLPIGSKGMAHAIQPGHEWDGRGMRGRLPKEEAPFISAEELSAIFNASGVKVRAADLPVAHGHVIQHQPKMRV